MNFVTTMVSLQIRVHIWYVIGHLEMAWKWNQHRQRQSKSMRQALTSSNTGTLVVTYQLHIPICCALHFCKKERFEDTNIS